MLDTNTSAAATANAPVPAQTDKKLERKKVWQFFWRSWAIMGSANYERMMAGGFLFGLAPTLDRLYPDESDPVQRAHKKEAYERHMALYNCTPQTSAFVLGLAASMEEEYARDREHFDPESINAVKAALMGPLSGIGDSFFQGTIKVVAFSLGVSLAQQGSYLGPVVALLVSIVPSILVTWFGAKWGYEGGRKYLKLIQGGQTMDMVMYICAVVGLMAVGAMTATMIGISTPLELTGGLKLQETLDSILPQMLSLGVTMGMLWLIRHNVSTNWLLVGSLVGGVALSAFGILG